MSRAGFDIDAAVIGAGVIGLAIARALAQAGLEVIVLEAEDRIGSVISARNSEVIHAGIYYPTASLKARLCVAGKHRLYDYCESHGVGHRRVGKLIVASEEAELVTLQRLKAQAAANGVNDLEWLDAGQVRDLEPAVHAVGALLSPSTGIIDSHAFMLALQGDLEGAGAAVAFRAPVRGGEVVEAGIRLDVGGAEPTRLLARRLVNAGGLAAHTIAASIAGPHQAFVPTLYLAKGNYYRLTRRAPFRHLIYPVPVAGGLGVHVSLDLAGQARFGPDVEWIETVDYDVDPRRADRFYDAIRRYWPALPDRALEPDYAGIRPKLVPAGRPAADFLIQGPESHGVPGLVNLFGIESPGLTAALAIAEEVAGRLI